MGSIRTPGSSRGKSEVTWNMSGTMWRQYFLLLLPALILASFFIIFCREQALLVPNSGTSKQVEQFLKIFHMLFMPSKQLVDDRSRSPGCWILSSIDAKFIPGASLIKTMAEERDGPETGWWIGILKSVSPPSSLRCQFTGLPSVEAFIF